VGVRVPPVGHPRHPLPKLMTMTTIPLELKPKNRKIMGVVLQILPILTVLSLPNFPPKQLQAVGYQKTQLLAQLIQPQRTDQITPLWRILVMTLSKMLTKLQLWILMLILLKMLLLTKLQQIEKIIPQWNLMTTLSKMLIIDMETHLI
jgi:hypothetical protein